MSKTQKIIAGAVLLALCGGALCCVSVTVPLGVVALIVAAVLLITAPFIADFN